MLRSAAADPIHGPDIERVMRRAPVLRWRRRVFLAALAGVFALAGGWITVTTIGRFREDVRQTLPIAPLPATPNLAPRGSTLLS